MTLLGTSPTIRTIPVPARVVGKRVLDARFELRDDGSVVLLDNVSLPTTQIPGIVARYAGDRWIDAASEPNTAAAGSPVRVLRDGGATAGLVAVDPLGHVIWERPDIGFLGGEGLESYVAGAITLALDCDRAVDPIGCASPRLVGLDAATGKDRWHLDGWYVLGPIDNGAALVDHYEVTATGTSAHTWSMIDTATGHPLAADQQWTGADTFRTGCCGEFEYLHTGRAGGIVIAVSGTDVRVWYPRDRTVPTVEVSLT